MTSEGELPPKKAKKHLNQWITNWKKWNAYSAKFAEWPGNRSLAFSSLKKWKTSLIQHDFRRTNDFQCNPMLSNSIEESFDEPYRHANKTFFRPVPYSYLIMANFHSDSLSFVLWLEEFSSGLDWDHTAYTDKRAKDKAIVTACEMMVSPGRRTSLRLKCRHNN